MTELARVLNGRVLVKVGDLTRDDADAIVNAANRSLMGGGGVDGAIHRAGGPEILAQCQEIRRTRYPEGLPVGHAVATTGGRLVARYVIHTVGPIYGRGGQKQAEQLAACYRNALRLAVGKALKTVAFPAISTGAYGYPADEAAQVSSKAIEAFLLGEPSLQEVRLVFFSQQTAEIFLCHHHFRSSPHAAQRVEMEQCG
jgi:O-acetyl-ADP-ribose deacetylase (regulator of RNase III)